MKNPPEMTQDELRAHFLEQERVKFVRDFVLAAVRAGSLANGSNAEGLVREARWHWAAIEATRNGG